MTRVGILGGSFDPVHLGHVRAAEAARDALALDRVLLVPNARQPLKLGRDAAPAEDRLAMVRLAVAGRPRLEASDEEIVRGGISYTIDTLRALRDRLGPDAEIFLLMGADTLKDLGRWKGADELAALATHVALTRPGYALEEGAGLPVRRLEVDALPVSSTEVRRLLAAGEPAPGLLDLAVADYIAKKGLYR